MDAVTGTFLSIGGFALVLLLLSLVGGHMHIGHVETGHFHLGGDLNGGIQLTLPAIAGFLGAFGFGGAAAVSVWGGSGVAAVLLAGVVGLCCGVPMSWMATRMMNAAINLNTDATLTSADLVGAVGVIVTPVVVGGYGEAQLTVAGQKMKFNARAMQSLACGAEILVIGVPSPSSVLVEPLPDSLRSMRQEEQEEGA